MSTKVEEIVKNKYKPQKPKKNNKQRKTNKGKRLRNGKYVFYPDYHKRLEKDSLKIKIKGKSSSKTKSTEEKIWKSEITGKTYSSEKRMRAAEKASERMKKIWEEKKVSPEWRLRKIKDIIGEGIDWEDLGKEKNYSDWSHTAGSLIYDIFYDKENNDTWEKLEYEYIEKWYKRVRKEFDLEKVNEELKAHGQEPIEAGDEERIGDYILMTMTDESGQSFYNFVNKIMKVPEGKIILH